MSAVAVLGSAELRRSLQRVETRRRVLAIALTLPLLVFLLATLLVPIGALLVRAIENPEIAGTLPRTGAALAGWDRRSEAPDAGLRRGGGRPRCAEGSLRRRRAGAAAEHRGGRRTLADHGHLPRPAAGRGPDAANRRARRCWHSMRAGPRSKYWQAIAKNASRWTPDYLLTAVDLKRSPDGRIEQVAPDQRVFGRILGRTFQISAIVTLCCLLLAYPLAYWLSTLPARKANVLMILVLVPFWTSILVRVAAWIVLLQREGLVNKSLLALSIVDEPLTLLFNRTGVIISMVHILLPFMILPLYSVMKSVPPTYLRAAVSLGSPPLAAFFRVYLPQTWPGIGAGGLLVFILAIGYYVTPALLGGADDQMLSYYIAQYTNVDVNWGMACALGTVLLAATLILYAVYRRVVKSELSLG